MIPVWAAKGGLWAFFGSTHKGQIKAWKSGKSKGPQKAPRA